MSERFPTGVVAALTQATPTSLPTTGSTVETQAYVLLAGFIAVILALVLLVVFVVSRRRRSRV